MSDRDDNFNFDDDFFESDRDNEISFDDDEPIINTDYDDEDMPEIDDAPEGGTNRTFVILAGLMILLFVIGIGVIVVIATRPTGPNDLELTATAVVYENATIQAYYNATVTQDMVNMQLTQTALAASPTPTATFTPTETPTETPEPPTNTPDLTAIAAGTLISDANAQSTALALTQTALAQPTNTPTPPPAVEDVNIRAFFATEVAFATVDGVFAQEAFATEAFFGALLPEERDPIVYEAAVAERQETLESILVEATVANEAGITVDNAIATLAANEPLLAEQVALLTQAAPELQGVLRTPAIEATMFAGQAQIDLQGQPLDNPDVIAATQNAFLTPPALATNEAIATQAAFATRNALVDLAVLGPPPTTQPTSALASVNQTATEIAGAFLTATANAQPVETTDEPVVVVATPTGSFIAIPTALPDTGLFDDIATGGGNTTWLALGIIGLIGVIVAARTMRKK